jgi:hypothetical protein
MGNGFILLHRCLEEDELWFLEPFTKAQAWVDLLLLASHCEFTFEIRGNKVSVGRGQLARSERFFQDRWHWSRNKVRAFFLYLEKVQKIVQQKSRIVSIITIVKYDEYQFKVQQKVQQKDHRKTTEGTTEGTTFNKQEQQETTKKEKKSKKEKFDFRQAVIDKGVDPQLVDAWMKVRKTKKATNTEHAFNGIAKQVEKSGRTWPEVVNQCAGGNGGNGWSGFNANWNWDSPTNNGNSRMDRTIRALDEFMEDENGQETIQIGYSGFDRGVSAK